MEDDLELAVRQLAGALRGRDPADPTVRLLAAALEAAAQVRQLGADEARRRADAAVRVLGVLAPDPDTKSHVRPGAPSGVDGAAEVAPPAPAAVEPPVAAPAPRGAGRDPASRGARRPDTGPRARPASAAHRAPAAGPPDRPASGPASRPGTRAEARPDTRARARSEEAPLVAAGRAAPGARGLRRPPGRPPDQEVSSALSELARAWAELGRGTLPSEPIELLAELVRTGVPDGPEAVRFHLALLRGVDLTLAAARYLPCEGALCARAAPLLRAASEGARRLGVQVHPGADRSGRTSGELAPCPVQTLPAFGEVEGAAVWVEQHGFAMADGRAEPAVVRVAVERPPPWFEALLEGYAAVVAAAGAREEGLRQARAYRAWLDELPGVQDAERRATTLRYAATAVFDAAHDDVEPSAPAARASFTRLAQALEQAGSYVIPLDTDELSDARRYELVLRPGVGSPRLVRPGFQGPGSVVQQRARVLADPGWLGTMSRT